LKIETKMRANLPKEDIKQQEVFDQLRTQLLSVKSRFTKSLGATTSPTAIKKGMIKTALGGLAGAFFLMLLVLLGQRMWVNVRDGGT
jgi:hypothetical protein